MKVIKKCALVATITTLIFTSCNTKKTEILQYSDNVVVVDLEDGKKVTVKKDDYGTYSFNDWNAFNVANTDLYEVENMDYNSSKRRIENLNRWISSLPKTAPNWIKTEEVLEDINNVQKEYEALLNERNKSTKVIRENWEDLSEKFDDLREEIEETIEDYQTE